jgi:mannose-6-phosphate isomerase-like protein (cupin superfamily)
MLLKAADLPSSPTSETFEGHAHDANVSFFLSHHPPGSGPRLHRHPYEEVFIVEEGAVVFTVGDDEIEAGPGDIVVAPARTPHKFLVRLGPARQINIHPVARMETEWLE